LSVSLVIFIFHVMIRLQCFDPVGWVPGRASSL